MNWSFAEKRFLHDSCKALFIDISEKEFKKDGVVIKISVLKFAPIDGRHSIGRKNIDAALTSRQLYAEGHVNLYEAVLFYFDLQRCTCFYFFIPTFLCYRCETRQKNETFCSTWFAHVPRATLL